MEIFFLYNHIVKYQIDKLIRRSPIGMPKTASQPSVKITIIIKAIINRKIAIISSFLKLFVSFIN